MSWSEESASSPSCSNSWASDALTLTGPGGSGKTRLSLQVAAEAVGRFAGGVFFVPLAAVFDPELVLPTVGQTIGAQDGVAEHVGEHEMLLLLDNLEQVLDAAPGLAELLERSPNLRLLITSRALLRIAGEHEYPVEPLPEEDAVALFRARAAVSEPLEAVQRSADAWTGFRLRSSWRRPARACFRRSSCSSGSSTRCRS